MYTDLLQQLGLNQSEANIYELLLYKGASKASDLVPESGMGRGNVYNALTSLAGMGLISVSSGKQQVYRVADPGKLNRLLMERKNAILKLEYEYREELPKIVSAYQLTTGKPVIETFEGYSGAEEVIYDSLAAKGPIYTYLDISAMTGEFAKINAGYVKKRIQRNIEKYLIVTDSAEARAFFTDQNTPFTFVAFVKGFPGGFQTAMEMYDDKITYFTLTPEKQISVMVNDAHIAAMHKAQFAFLWQTVTGAPIAPNSQPAPRSSSEDGGSRDQRNTA